MAPKLHTGLMCTSHKCFYMRCSQLCGPWSTSSHLVPDDVLATERSASLVLWRGTVCRPTFVLHQHCLLSKIGLRLICFAVIFCSSIVNLIRVAYVVWRPSSDSMGHVTAPYKLLCYYYYYYTNQHYLCLYHQCSTTVNSGACFYQTHLEEVKLQKHSEERT